MHYPPAKQVPRGLASVLKLLSFLPRKNAMMMFVTTLAVGAVAGFMMEKQFGSNLVRWSRMQRMRARVLRRQGVSPWRAWFDED